MRERKKSYRSKEKEAGRERKGDGEGEGAAYSLHQPEFGEPFTWIQESYLNRNDSLRLKNKKEQIEGEGKEYKAGAF